MPLAPIYDPEAVAPMWQELAAVGVEPLTTPEQVDAALGTPSGTVLVIVNSICGCAAGHARPGAMLALQNKVIPDRSVTVFAGVDRDAVNRAREYHGGLPALLPLDGPLQGRQAGPDVAALDLQQMNDDQVGGALAAAFDEHCAKTGPSVDAETFRRLQPYRAAARRFRC